LCTFAATEAADPPAMKALRLLLLLSALVAGIARAAGPGDAVLGRWLVETKDAVVEISRTGDLFVGTIVWLKDPVYTAEDGPGLAGKPVTDRANPDQRLRSRPLIGLSLLDGLHFDGVDHWRDGRVYNADDGRTYHCQLYMPSPNELKLRGYVGIALFGSSTTWTRVARLPP
jgi:uncharacterized protein (DUF2147 family)